MGTPLQRHLDDLFSIYRPTNGAETFYCLGRLLARVITDEITVAEVGIGHNPIHLDNIKSGVDHETNSEKKVKLIGIDPNNIPPPHIEFRKGKAQELPLEFGEVKIVICYDLLKHMDGKFPSWELALQKLCEEAMRVSPEFLIFSDPNLYFKLRKMSGKGDDYAFICSRLSPCYTEIGLQKYVEKSFSGRFGPPHRWSFFEKVNGYDSNLK